MESFPTPPSDCSGGATTLSDIKDLGRPQRKINGNIFTLLRADCLDHRIVPFMKRATLPTVSTLDHSNITAFISIDETVFIAYVLPGDEALKSTFTELAARHHDKYTFGIATETADSMTLPSIVCHQVKEGEEKVLSTQASIDALEKFIEEATAPTIGEFTRRNEMKYMKVCTSSISHLIIQMLIYISRQENLWSTTSPAQKKSVMSTGHC
jgi:hypothetical protein